MTLALGCAIRTEPSTNGGGSVWLMSDTRLTFGDDGHLDVHIKALTLGPRSAVVAAGHSTPVGLAVEAARPFIAATSVERAKRSLSPISVWTEASLVWTHLRMIFAQFQELVTDARVCVIVGGFFSDATPGLVRLEMSRESGEVLVFRPGPGERVYTVAGVQEYIPILYEAFRRSRPPEGRGYHTVGSVLWDIIKHQGEPTRGVGGGLAFGFVNGDADAFQWPIIDIDTEELCRGLRYRREPHWPKPMKIEYDPTLFARLEQQHAASPLAAHDAPGAAVVLKDDGFLGDGQLLTPPAQDDTWLLALLQSREQSTPWRRSR